MEVNGFELTCPHCGGKSFTVRQALLNTKWMTFWDLDFLNKRASTYICDGCGRIEWFFTDAKDPEFAEWLAKNPENRYRDEADQIALYQDYKRANQ